jgi:hypothetical protein
MPRSGQVALRHYMKVESRKELPNQRLGITTTIESNLLLAHFLFCCFSAALFQAENKSIKREDLIIIAKDKKLLFLPAKKNISFQHSED